MNSKNPAIGDVYRIETNQSLFVGTVKDSRGEIAWRTMGFRRQDSARKAASNAAKRLRLCGFTIDVRN